MLEKTYQPADIEARIHKDWEAAGAFRCNRPDRLEAEPYCIVIPPPNVTGSLHMGHALNNSLQDVLCRFERMRGKDVLWQPGTDHAGIATQMVVERQMMQRQEPGRRAIGREKFLAKVWAWKEESGGTIVNQLKRLGASCDWSRERFTMDAGLSEAVIEFFVRLHEAGHVYKAKRLVNWDPKLLTAISDLEVEQVELKGSLWHFAYPLAGDPSQSIVVATTRPETMLGDTAVAVHPDDERYKHLIGKMCLLPLVNRPIPIVGDSYSDPAKGSGAVKITPAHDFNDFEVGKRHSLRQINIFTAEAKMLLKDNADFLSGAKPAADVMALEGQDRFAARKKIVALMEAAGHLVKIEPHAHTVPHGDRSLVPVEPWLTDQWYVDVKPLADRALAAVRKGDTRIVPENYEKTYFDWLENIQPWCVSRQLWWGHQIPAWYGPDGGYVVARNEKDAKAKAKAKWGKDVPLKRDEDVLDTWFSSALWPFSTLGWPEKTPELKKFYPTSTLVTGFDIIFFWVARMMMAGLFTQDKVPFRDVYIHGLVRDEKGQKMSKTKGNVIDPLTVIDKYGADALRFALTVQSTQGRDLKLSMQRIEGYRNFATKLWNAARFAEMNECVRQRDFDPKAVSETINRWIAGETERVVTAVTAGITEFKFNEAAGAAYDFIWGTFCDWYLEFAKPIFIGADEAAKAETRATTAWALDQILKLLHPFMPFVTEELWSRLVEVGVQRQSLLALSQWPDLKGLANTGADDEIGWLVTLISEVRSVRSEMNVPAGAKIPLTLVGASETTKARIARHEDTIKRLARLDMIGYEKAPPKGSAQMVVGEATACVPLAGVIDMGAEKKRLGKAIADAESDMAKMDAKLSNPSFMAKAKSEAIEEAQDRKTELDGQLAKLRAALKRVEAAV